VRLIVVPIADRPECRVALDAAFRIAKDVGADVAGYHMRAHRTEPRASGENPLTPGAASRRTPAAAVDAVLDSKGAHALYQRAVARHGFVIAKRSVARKRSCAFWSELVGTPERIFGIVGPVADLAVVSRPKIRSAGRAKAFLLAALLHSVKPVLVMPQKRRPSIGKRIVIAWNQSAEAALAVAAGLPLLTRAERVVVVSSGPENRLGPKAAHLAKYLAHWDVDAALVRAAGRNVEQELVDAYRKADGDLFLMGAYSRSRFRELVFGGVTEHMLFKTDVPVFTVHRG
jgi:nucleotide-binding universal stress UspA family protein